jgi:hypothetical protein
MRPEKHSSFGAGDLRVHDIQFLLRRFFGFEQERQLELFSARDEPRLASSPDDNSEGLFDAGPPQQLQVRLGLIHRGRLRPVRRAVLVAVLGWVPLLVLCAIQSALFHNGDFESFITDYGAIARSLIAAPVLVIAEAATRRG